MKDINIHITSELIENLTPYEIDIEPFGDKFIKLDDNENPYPPTSKAIIAIKKSVNKKLNIYPSSGCEDLRIVIAGTEGLPSKEYVHVTNGLDEAIWFCCTALFKKKSPVLFPDITYAMYPAVCNLLGLSHKEIPLDANMNTNTEDYYVENSGILISNPNNITGTLVNIDEIIALMNKNKESAVVLDETFIDFGGQSAVKLINKYNNLIIIKTTAVSHSLAGLGMGYILAHPYIIDNIRKVKNSVNIHNIGTIAQMGTKAALEDYRYKTAICEKIIRTRKRIKEELIKTRFNVVESKANFLLISHDNIKAEQIYEYLKQNGFLVKHIRKPERLSSYIRVTIGTDNQMDKFAEMIAIFEKQMFHTSF